MGITSQTQHRSTAPFFSPVQARLLELLYTQPDRQFQGAELIRLARAGTGATHRQLQQLTQAGILAVRTIGSQKFYQANRSSPIFDELRSIVLKTFGLAQPLRDALEPLQAEIISAFVYGSIARGSAGDDSDIDLMVLSDSLDYGQVFEAVQHLEAALSRAINPTVMSVADWKRKRAMPESFVSRVADGAKVWVQGSEDELP